MKIRYRLNTLLLLALLGAAAAPDAQVQPQLAERYFKEATTLCERDAGRLWGVSLCGPMVIFDQTTGTRATSQPEPEGQAPRFPGFADGPVSWGGLRWFSFPLYMLPEKDADARQQIMLHGLFHRIQPELGFMADDGFNEHLDTLEGRVSIQLEWRALRLRRRFVDGPVLTMPAAGSGTSDTTGSVSIPGAGTVFFRNFTLSAQWGRLTANGGVLRAADGSTLSVPAARPLEGTTLQGDGWSATLNSGWVVRPAPRPGSFAIVREN